MAFNLAFPLDLVVAALLRSCWDERLQTDTAVVFVSLPTEEEKAKGRE